MNKKILWGIIGFVVIAAAAYAIYSIKRNAGQNTAQLAGTVSYRECIALPSGSQVEIQIRDASKADEAGVIAKKDITTQGENIPISFTIDYDASKIATDGSYDLSARILVDGQLRWMTDANVSLLENGAPKSHVDLMLTSTGNNMIDSADLEGKKFRMISYNGGAVPEGTNYTLEFKNGSVSARICNSISGKFTLSGNTINGMLIMTEMFCTGPVGIMEIEEAFNSIWNAGAILSLSGDDLTLAGDGKTMIFTRN